MFVQPALFHLKLSFFMILTLIGLGNPGIAYQRTRHNIGFLVIDEIAKRYGLELRLKPAMEAELAEGTLDQLSVRLCKPHTFMNATGRSIQKIRKKKALSEHDMLVIYDDADLPFGDVRFKAGGSSAGHRGIQSILDQFPNGTSIPRIRIGIGRPAHPDIGLEDFVLQKWTQKEEKALPEIIDRVITMITKEYA